MHYFVNLNVPGMVAIASKLRTSNNDFYYCTPEKVWSPYLQKFGAFDPNGDKKFVSKLPRTKWEKRTKNELMLDIEYGQFLRKQDNPMEFEDAVKKEGA